MRSLRALLAPIVLAALESPTIGPLLKKRWERLVVDPSLLKWLLQTELALAKIDPSPAVIAAERPTPVTIIVRATNLTAEPLPTNVACSTDEKGSGVFAHNGVLTLSAGETTVLECTTSFLTPGWHTVADERLVPTGRT